MLPYQVASVMKAVNPFNKNSYLETVFARNVVFNLQRNRRGLGVFPAAIQV
jgi:hypothetical protein